MFQYVLYVIQIKPLVICLKFYSMYYMWFQIKPLVIGLKCYSQY